MGSLRLLHACSPLGASIVRRSLGRRSVLVAIVASMGLFGVHPAAQAHDSTLYYKSKWKRDVAVDYRFTNSFPLAFRERGRDAARQWNEAFTQLTYVEKESVADFNPATCPSTYQMNAFHWVTIDGAFQGSNGSGATLARVRTCVFSSSCPAIGVPGTCELYSAQVEVDRDESWYLGTGDAPLSQADGWSVASHELGHATGWSGHFSSSATICENNADQHTMCPTYYLGTERMRTLEQHDKHTILEVYGGGSA